MKSKEPTVIGEVTEILGAGRYRVVFTQYRVPELICFLGGKMKINHINVYVGDRVEVIVDPYGGTATNRIVRRM